jgi:HD superfamily phosphohydrolase
MTVGKPRRVRDPVHNLITFGADTFDQMLWRVIETPPFQRLRRIRQLGFSEFVFTGATHTRFAHSLGVLHTARQLMRVIERLMGADHHPQRAYTAIAAALVHDVGHGMFSHAFEEIGRTLKIELAEHETASERIIRDSEITRELNQWSPHFAEDVADLVTRRRYASLYDSVVSSQFDADRLDYMQRDRLMTGVESSRVDVSWLLANLEIASVPVGADDQPGGIIQTLMLGPKAYYVAEAHVLALFQLYPNVYFHKTTRAAEKVFCDLTLRLIALVDAGDGERTGLPNNHPLLRFAEDRTSLARLMALDDAVFWGAVPMLMDAEDEAIADRARRLWTRHSRILGRC